MMSGVTANFKETQLKKMRVGQKVQIEVDAMAAASKYEGPHRIASLRSPGWRNQPSYRLENATMGNYVKVVQRVPVKIVLEKGQKSRITCFSGRGCP